MRRTIAAALATLTVAAFALTPGHAAQPVFAPSYRVTGGEFTEPGIHVGPDGTTAFVDGPAGTPGHSILYRSTDGTATWERVSFDRPFHLFPGGGDSDVAIRGNRIFFLDLWLGSDSIIVSEDNGETWTSGSPISTLPASDRQWIGLGKRDPLTGLDTVYVVYAQVSQSVMIARSRTSGLTWEFHAPAPGIRASSGSTSQLVTDGDEFLAFGTEDGGVYRAAYSSDEGATWGTSVIASNVENNIPGFAMDGDTLWATWTDRDDYSVWVASSPDRGVTWPFRQVVSEPNSSAVFPWIDARGGKTSVAWYGASDPDGVPVPATDPMEVPPNTVWHATYAERATPSDAFSTPIKLGVAKTGIICTAGLSCDLNGIGNRGLGDFMSVVIGNDGKALVAYGGRVGVGVRLARQTA